MKERHKPVMLRVLALGIRVPVIWVILSTVYPSELLRPLLFTVLIEVSIIVPHIEV